MFVLSHRCGLRTVLVDFTSSAAIVFKAAENLGAMPEEIGSWMCALGNDATAFLK
jgi:benzoate membrane transport protein